MKGISPKHRKRALARLKRPLEKKMAIVTINWLASAALYHQLGIDSVRPFKVRRGMAKEKEAFVARHCAERNAFNLSAGIVAMSIGIAEIIPSKP